MSLEDQIAKVCIDEFTKLQLASKSKLVSNTEYIILAGIVLSDFGSTSHSETFKCLSLGTGTKCLAERNLACIGDSLNDCHAEIIAKRGFQKYLWDQCSMALEDNSEIFNFIPENLNTNSIEPPFVLKNPNIKFHLYISQAPCGDASTEPLDKVNAIHPENHKAKRFKSLDKVNFTSSILKGRENFELKGTLRTKPGRIDSEPTLSLSCSDKIARWNILGLQGGILGTYFISPIYVNSIIIGELYDENSLSRALIHRLEKITGLQAPYHINHPSILSTKVPFIYGKYYQLKKNRETENIKDLRPQEITLAWSLNQKPEIIVSGRKQGAGKDRKTGLYSIKTRSSICRASFFELYKTFVQSTSKSVLNTNCMIFPLGVTYLEIKIPKGILSEKPYQVSRNAFLTSPPFKSWLVTKNIVIDYNNFT